MDEIDVTRWGPWIFLLYIVIKDIVPALFPSLIQSINKRTSTDDRLFAVIKENNETSKELIKVLASLEYALDGLKDTIENLDVRMTSVEMLLNDSTGALQVARKLIKP